LERHRLLRQKEELAAQGRERTREKSQVIVQKPETAQRRRGAKALRQRLFQTPQNDKSIVVFPPFPSF
jgi:hypothetical protein